MSRKRTGCLIGVIVLAILLAWIVYVGLRYKRGVENAYAAWNVGDFIIDHMETHDGQWPRNWDDLQAAYARRSQRDVGEDMSYYKDLIEVDFNVDPKVLAKVPWQPGTKDPPFRVVRQRRTPHMHWNEPNEMIWGYLNGGYRATQPASKPATQPTSAKGS